MRSATLILTALAVLAIGGPAAAGEAPGQWTDEMVQGFIANAPSETDYPDAAAVFVRLDDTVEYAADGSMHAWWNSLAKVLTLMGRERYSNRTFLYNSDESVLTLARGVTVRESGRVVEVERDAVNDVTPAFLQGATMYANVLEKVVSFPVAGPGATMELRMEETRRPMKDGSFGGVETLGMDDPVMDATFTLRYPADHPVPKTVAVSGAIGDITIEKSSKAGEIVFSIEDIPGIVPEEQMPPAAELYPRVVYTSYDSWDQAAAFLAGEFFPHVQTEGPVAERAAQTTAGMTADEDRVRALFLDVATGVRSVYLDLGTGGYEPNDASAVLSNRYGDTRDKTVLLVSMLRAAGIEAWPAAVAARPVPAGLAAALDGVPTLSLMDHLLVAVRDGAGYRFLDPIVDDAPYGYLRWGRGNTALLVRDDGTGERVSVPAFEPKENVAHRFLTVTMNPDGSAAVEAKCSLTGYFDRKTRMALKDALPTDVQKAFDTAANAVSAGAKDVSHTMTDLADLAVPVTVSQEIDAPDFAVPQGDMMVVRVPPFPYDFAATGIAPTLSERKFPFEYPCEVDNRLEVTIRVPQGYDVARIPETVSVSTPVAEFDLACRWNADQRTIVWQLDTVVRSRRIEVPDYAAFKAGHDAVTAPKNRLVLLKKAA
jgi:hypothetical protein